MGTGGGTYGGNGHATGSHRYRCESESAPYSHEALESGAFERTSITMGAEARANMKIAHITCYISAELTFTM